MTTRRPKHAQPSMLAGLRWSSATQWVGLALLAALGAGVLATVDAPAHPAAARAPAPPSAVVNTGSNGQVDVDGPPAEQPPAAVSLAPTSSVAPTSTVFSPPSGLLDNTLASALASDGIPSTALQAYEQAAARERRLDPACGLTWPLLAGIGRAESDHGRFAGAVLHSDGISTPRVIGIPLNGNGTALIRDTDNGLLDGDPVYDRAVGPMQFIPSTWERYGVDANDDGFVDPFNIFDAAAGAANYLCSTGQDLTTLAGQMAAVRVYNDSDAYISTVLQLEAIYASGVPGLTVPVIPTDTTPTPVHVARPPVNPGPPLGIPPKKPPKPKPPKKPTSTPTPSAPSTSSATQSESPCPTPSSTSAEPPDPSTSATASPTTTSATPTPSPTGTECPTPTTTPTPTRTPTPSPSPTDTCTPTPSDTGTGETPTPTSSTSVSASSSSPTTG